MRLVGTTVRGIRTPIIKENDDLASIVVDSVINASESEGFNFKDKDIILCYDNDEPGYNGMVGMFKSIRNLAKSVKYVKIGDVVKNEKEDFYDYITKYNGDVFEFYSLNLHQFKVEEIDRNTRITIKEALNSNKLRRNLI